MVHANLQRSRSGETITVHYLRFVLTRAMSAALTAGGELNAAIGLALCTHGVAELLAQFAHESAR